MTDRTESHGLVRAPGETRFVNSLRARGEALRLAPTDAPAPWTVRVQGAEVWDAIRAAVLPSTPVLQLKRAAMAELMPDVTALDEYAVKLHGIEIHDESRSLETVGGLDGSTYLIVSRRRRPVR